MKPIKKNRFVIRVIALTVFTGSIAACSNDSSTDTTASSDSTISSDSSIPDSISLAGVCPEKVIIQTDWWPQSEHGFVYQMLGDGYTVNTENMSVSGPLVSEGQTTGVDIQINAGGAAINERVLARMYSKPEILLGFTGTDIAISQSEALPTIGVVAPFNINPQIIMWDPATYPEVRTINELKDAQVRVLYYQNVAYMTYLTGAGILDESQIDPSYEGVADQFVIANGKIAQQGYGTNEPIFYENKLEKWMKPVRYQYLHEIGWTPYAQTLAVTPANKEEFNDCLAKLVPIIQQAQVDFVLDPAKTNETIVDVVTTLNPATAYDLELATLSADKQVTDRLVSNSPDGTLGSFDLNRIEQFIATAAPIFIERGDSVKDSIAAKDLVTNEYIDFTISLPEETAR